MTHRRQDGPASTFENMLNMPGKLLFGSEGTLPGLSPGASISLEHEQKSRIPDGGVEAAGREQAGLSGYPHMDLIATLQIFLRVSEKGSFSAVAAERGVTQPAISRQVSALEEHLGTRLVQRTTQAVSLTEEGRDLVPKARDLVAAADMMLEVAKHRRGKPVGSVRLAMSVAMATYFSGKLETLLGQHDELSLELVVRDWNGNLVEEGLDLEIRMGVVDDSALISRRIGTAMPYIIASPEYLRDKSHPSHPTDLEQHECIVHNRFGNDDVWWFSDFAASLPDSEELPVNVRGRFSSNSSSAIHRAAIAGQGIAALSYLLVTDDIKAGRLIRLLPGYQFRRRPLYVVYPSRRSLPTRTRVVIDWLIKVLNEDPQLKL
jgi:DNA-binding transcriptional LysR family regulator